MALLTIPETIEVGEASTYLSALSNAKQSLFSGGPIVKRSPLMIKMITDALTWGYEGGSQTAQSLRNVANYLIWLCGPFQLQAQYIMAGNGGGTVIPIVPSTRPSPLDFEVDASSVMATGDSQLNITAFIGYNVQFARNGVEQNITDVGGSYFSWNRETGLFEISPAAQLGELFRITPV